MANSFREALAGVMPDHQHKLLFYEIGGRHQGYNTLSIAESLKQFCTEILPQSPVTDPRGKRISIIKNNFPKLSGLEHLTLSKDEFGASDIIAAIEDGTFDPGQYDPTRDDRLRTLFWIPEMLRDPDAIYKNAHKIVQGDEVYVRVYDKMGSKVKLIFTKDIRKNGQLIRTVPITSFLTDPATAISYVCGQPKYRRQK